MTTGTVSVIGGPKNKKVQISFTNSRQQYVRKTIFERDTIKLPEEQISLAIMQKLKTDISQLKNLKVEFEEKDDQIFQLREQNQNWDRGRAAVGEIPSERIRPKEESNPVNPDNFHNPYNFIPALPRNQVSGELGDRKPKGHGCYLPNYWSGRISVKVTTVTPLLIPDAAEMTEDDHGHKTYPMRLGADGRPYLPPTSIKGMLRSAYEAVTNSRLSVFDNSKHNSLLAYRLPASTGIQMVPARIENGKICLYPGTSVIGEDGRPDSGNPMYAAWLRRWNPRTTGHDRQPIIYAGTDRLPLHGQHVSFWAEEFTKYNSHNRPIFTYWKVRSVVPYGQDPGPQPEATNHSGSSSHRPTGRPICKFKGYVCITNKNIPNKHDERIFFENRNKISIPLDDDSRQRWSKLIESYQSNDDFINGLPCPSALGNRASWSRHIMGGSRERKLSEGTLCYAQVKKERSRFKVIDLHPVMISRSLYRCTPAETLNPSLKPATNYDDLSPADRVFGWVSQNGQGSYKGQLRVHSVNCLDNDAIENFGNDDASVPLAILGQPKPEQARFYCAENENGQPLNHGEENPSDRQKSEGYSDREQNLRGRKVYPHHKGLPSNYWQNPVVDRTQTEDDSGRYQEYRRPQQDGVDQLDKQNRSIKNWVRPETKFRFEIDVINLSSVELGALLWLLSSPDIHYHRLGGAKPLGFGSVWINVEKTDLRLGSSWAEFYQSLKSQSTQGDNGLSTVEDFKTAVEQIYGNGKRFRQIRFIAAFCNSSKGFDDAAIHYPRVTNNPTPEGEAFEWFVRNEQDTGKEEALKCSLPDLAGTTLESLALNPRRPRPWR